MRDFIRQWYGVLTTAAVAVSALWLVYAGKHTLFVHPRYTIFITEMSLLALVACVWALARGISHEHEHASDFSLAGSAHSDDAGHEHAHVTRSLWASAVTGVLVVTALVMVLAVPPAPLSANLAGARATAQAAPLSSNIIRSLADLPTQPTVADWAQLLISQTKDDLTNQPAQIDGFVTADDDIASQGYYLVRFRITCCAVDAFPARVPVYDPQWREHVEIGQWVKVEGKFQPSTINIHEEWMLHPERVTPIDEPDQPYLF